MTSPTGHIWIGHGMGSTRVGWSLQLLETQVQRPKIKCDPRDNKGGGQQCASTAGWMAFFLRPLGGQNAGYYNTTEANEQH